MSIINFREVTIDTVSGAALSIGQILLKADKRGKDLPDHERIRRAVLPVGQWGELSASTDGTPMQGLTDLLRDALRDIASERLRDTLAENPLTRTVALADYTVGALLAWNAESASSRGSITVSREQIEAWYPGSALHKAMAVRGAQYVDFIGKRVATLAAKNHGLKKPEDADKLIVLLAEDATTAIGAELIQRLTFISKSLQQRTSEAVSMDDI